MSEPRFFFDARGQSIVVGDDPRKCSRCGRGPEPVAVIDNSASQFAAIALCVQCLSELVTAVTKNFTR